MSTTSPQRPASTPVAVALIGGIVLAGRGSSAQPAGVARYCVRLLASLPPSCPAAPYGVELRGLGSIHVPWTGRKGGWRWADYVVVEGVLDDGVMTVSRVAKVLAPG